jgi:RNA-splicing ligase RtcB
MGARSYIVRGKGNAESFESCSHGAGRVMSRGEAKRRFTLADHRAATEGVECRKDKDVIDETPAAYKDIDAVMAGAAGPGRGGAHAEAGGVREGLKVRSGLSPPSVWTHRCDDAALCHNKTFGGKHT